MLLIVLFGFISAAVIPSQIIRIDRDTSEEGAYSKKLISKFVDAQPTIDLSSKAATASNAFSIIMECPDVTTSQCNKARQGLRSAGRRIAEVLKISKTITMYAKFYSFGPDRSTTLGSATYSAAFFVRKSDGYFMYNQALLKQLNTDVSFPTAEYDIVADFNSDINWYFGDGEISKNQQDFEYAAAHELTHGLGFGSGFIEYGSVYPEASEGYLAPIAIKTPDNNRMEFQSLEIYDSFITGGNREFKEIGRLLNEFEPRNTTSFSKLVGDFQSSESPFRAAQDAKSISSKGSGTLIFNANNGIKAQLYSPKEFDQGSSIHHLDTVNSNTADFLMVPILAAGVTVDELMSNTNSNSIYGPQTLSIMESIGWPTVKNPKVSSVTLAQGSHKAHFGSAQSRFQSKLILILSLFIILF